MHMLHDKHEDCTAVVGIQPHHVARFQGLRCRSTADVHIYILQ